MMRRCRCLGIVVAAIGLALAAAPAAHAGGASRSAYEQLDPNELAKALADRQMTELLRALSEQLKEGAGGKDVQSLVVSFQTKRTLAASAVSEAERTKLLDEAADVMRQVIEKTKGAKDPEKVMEHFRFRFELAKVIGQMYAEPHALRLEQLQGSEQDRKILQEKATQAAELLVRLNSEIERTIQDWRLDRKKLVWAVPLLEDFQKKVAYQSAWVYFYSGMALPRTPKYKDERIIRLQDAIRGVDEWADGEANTGVKWWSLLLRGMALRELGEYENALASLRKAANGKGEGMEGIIRVRALFQITRTLTEMGNYKAAEGAIGQFREKLLELYGKQGSYMIDLLAALLWEDLYNKRAAKNKQKAAAFREMAIKKLLEVPATHTGWAEQKHWAGIIRQKYGEDADDNPAVVYAAALGPLAQWRDLRAKKQTPPPALEKKVLDNLHKITEGKHETYKQAWQYVLPVALWREAFIRNWQKRNKEAGELFLQVARNYPKHPLARKAAEFAARSYLGVIRERARQDPGKTIDPKLRQGLIDALEVLVKNWAKTKDGKWDPAVTTWYRDLGLQYERLAWMTSDVPGRLERFSKAIEGYQNFVACGQPKAIEKLRVTHRILELRCARFDYRDQRARAKPDEDASRKWNGARKEVADALQKELTSYADQVRSRTKEAQGKLKEDLVEWGSLADYRAGELLYEVLDRVPAALRKMRELPTRWPGSRVVIDAHEFVIRKLIMRERTPEAIEELKKFKEEFKDKPERYQRLVAAIIQQISLRIRKLSADLRRNRTDTQTKQLLTKYRNRFHMFAKDLYDPEKDKPLADRYGVTKLYASALLEKGAAEQMTGNEADAKQRFDEALALFRACEDLDKAERKKKTDAIDREFNAHVEEVRKVSTIEDCRRAKGAYLAELKAKTGIVPKSDPDQPDPVAGPSEVAGALDYLVQCKQRVDEANKEFEEARRGGEPADKVRELDEKRRNAAKAFAEAPSLFRKKLARAYYEMADLRKQWLPVDDEVTKGLARAFACVGRHAEAVKYFHQYLQGLLQYIQSLANEKHPDHAALWRVLLWWEKYPELSQLWWDTTLEYCQSVVKGYSGKDKLLPEDRAALKALVQKLDALKLTSYQEVEGLDEPQVGGYVKSGLETELDAVRRQAETMLEQD